ncbi:MAG: cell division protein FtsZ [Verrucomicrobiia bacterium]|jgi:cell division protein FtsZ
MNGQQTNPAKTANGSHLVDLRLVGVGNAGCRIIGRISESGFPGVKPIAINTDAPDIEQCRLPEKYLIGITTTRGMGTGGNPDCGRQAASENEAQLTALFKGADVVLIVAGLGRGTGTGATPALASYAKEAGALVLSVVTMPFEFEGGRCTRQAFMGLRYLNQIADGVICVYNDSFSRLIPTDIKFHDNLKIINDYLAEGICSLLKMLTYQGEMNTTFADLCSMLNGKHARSAIATVTAAGPQRANQICEKLLKHPMLESDNALANAESVLVNFSSNGDITTEEVRIVMDLLKLNAKKAFLKVGESVDPKMNGQLGVTVLTACPVDAAYHQQLFGGATSQTQKNKEVESSKITGDYFLNEEETDTYSPSSAMSAPPPVVTSTQISSIIGSNSGGNYLKPKNLMQGMFDFEVVSHGRFEKNDATIYEGQNLDVPTFYRLSIKLN